MKRVFLLMAVSALLVTLGPAQTSGPGGTTDPVNVKGCLGGSDGAYTVTEDGTRQIFKITTSSVDLKPHLGHDVKLIGSKATGTVSSGAADHSFAVTELTMISEQCAVAAAATVGAAAPDSGAVVEPTAGAAATAGAPAADTTAPPATASTPAAEAAPATTVTAPTVDTATPQAVSPAPATVSTPVVDAVAPATTVSPSPAAVNAPAAEAAPVARPSAHARKNSATRAVAAAAPEATVSPAPDPVSPAVAAAPAAATTVSPSAETVSTPAATAPAPAVTHRAGSLSLLIGFVVLVIVLGTMAPLIGRWRKRKMLERNGSPNLSFTNEVNPDEVIPQEAGSDSDQDKPQEPRRVA
jgi:hypothetical protein